jgi:hypothetical protein
MVKSNGATIIGESGIFRSLSHREQGENRLMCTNLLEISSQEWRPRPIDFWTGCGRTH